MHYLKIALIVNKIISMVKDRAYYTPEHIHSIILNWMSGGMINPNEIDSRGRFKQLENPLEKLIIDGISIGNMYDHVKNMDHLTFQSFERRWRSRHYLLRSLYHGLRFEDSPTTFRIHFSKKHIDVHIPGLPCEFCERQRIHSANPPPKFSPNISVCKLVATPRMIKLLDCTRGMNFDDYRDITLTGYRNSLYVSQKCQITNTNGDEIYLNFPRKFFSKESYPSLLRRMLVEPDGTVWQDPIPIILDLMSKFTRGIPELYHFETRQGFVPFIRLLKEPRVRNLPLFDRYAFQQVYHLLGFDIPRRKRTLEESSEPIPKQLKTKHE